MDSSITEAVDDVLLERVVDNASHHLEELGYSRRSLRRYDTIWRALIGFAEEKGFESRYSEELATAFVEACRAEPDGSSGWQRHVACGVKVLGDFHRHGRIARPRADRRMLTIPPAMRKPLEDYEDYARDRLHLRRSSLNERTGTIAKFLDFLGSRGVETLPRIQPSDLTAFVTSLGRYRPRTVSRNVSDVRQFLRFLTMRGILHRDLSATLPRIRVPRDAAIPSVWDAELVVKLLAAVDRSSPIGKRDYAMLLLASRLGLRVGDLRSLRLDDLDWDAATIDITQSKTGAPQRLPLPEDVGEALIDYLRFGRPANGQHREVFLRHKPPVGPFGDRTQLHYVVNRWRQLAGIRFRSPQRHGFHSLRHTLATRLLREQTPIHVIAEILGHASSESTLIYTKVDTEMLREAALDTEEVQHVG